MVSTQLLWAVFFSLAAGSQALNKVLPLPPSAPKAECTNFQNAERFDCFPENGATQQACESRGCCWVPAGKTGTRLPLLDVPWCFYPRNYGGYKYVNVSSTPNGQVAYLQRSFQSAYPRDVQTVRIDVEQQTDSRVRVKISDAEKQRYETPYPKISNTKSIAKAPSYVVDIDQAQDGFEVRRLANNEVIFTSRNVGGFIFSDQFLQISSPFKGHIYGLGEHRSTLWADTNWNRFTMFNHDSPPFENVNLYGSHPFYMVVNTDGSSYGVYLHNSNAMDVLLQPLPAITFRPIGGILDLYFFMGPTPAEVLRQYTELIGRPIMPPYWSLGFQLCKYGYNSADNTRAVWQRTRDAGIPFDVQWNDIDYMITQNDFTIDPVRFATLPQLVNDIHAAGMHYVPILDPGVSAAEPAGTYPPYDDGINMDVFVKTQDNRVFIGKVWNPTSTAFPDFFHPRALEYWSKQIRELHARIPFDGLWIDMNEPANFLDGTFDGCPQHEMETPQYYTGVAGDYLAKNTVCMTAKQAAGDHYNLHNLYGISEAEITNLALRDVISGKRPFVLSRSTFAGSGKYTGHWGGDNLSSWYDLTKSVPELLIFSIFGMPYMGSDICGFRDDAWESLCNRWMQLGAFYPFSRNHNSIDHLDQDPVAMGQLVVNSSKKALNVRYTLLPYLYTLFYHAHVNGDTVSRPLFVEFANDSRTHEVDRSFMWGSGLYIIPVTEDVSTNVKAYLPAGKWYDWYSGSGRQSSGEEVTLDAPLDTIPLLIRGGNVLPTQAPAVTTTLSRQNKFTYIAALDNNGNAKGSLFWDDGDSPETVESNQYGLLTFDLSNQHLTSTVETWKSPDTPTLESIKVLGVSGSVQRVTVNGQSATFSQDTNNALIVTGLSSPLSEALDMTWS